MSWASKICLGTAQFGNDYGIANLTGKIPRSEAANILREAKNAGIEVLDTAIGYGDSESQLGSLGVNSWRVITKLPPIPKGCENVNKWVGEMLAGSVERLRVRKLFTVLLHHPADLLDRFGVQLSHALLKAKEDGLVEKIGVSIYDTEILESLAKTARLDVVQAPLNLLDRRLISSGWLQHLKDADVEIHIRSVFLQGALLLPRHVQEERFEKWAPIWRRYSEWLMAKGISSLEACIHFAFSIPDVDKVVIGVDSSHQLRQVIEAGKTDLVHIPKWLSTNDVELIDPRRWKCS